jgi:hypothetical protein
LVYEQRISSSSVPRIEYCSGFYSCGAGLAQIESRARAIGQAQARALEAEGQSVDWDAVNKNLQQFADQTQQALQNYLGQGSFNRMQQNGVFPFNQ